MKRSSEKILIGCLYKCQADIDNPENVSVVLKNAAQIMQVKPVKECYYKYQPCGLTYVMIIKESVIMFSSYPETRSGIIYLSSCRLDSDLKKALEYIGKELKSEEIKIFFDSTVML